MSDMKCPFCSGELVGTIGHPICRNQNCVVCDDPMPQDLLEELIRTRKALDKAERLQKAVDLALNWLHTIATAHHPTTTYYNLDAQTAIDEIKQLIKGE